MAHEMNLKKMPDERKGPNLECPSIPTLSPFPSYFSVPSILSSPFPALSIIRGSFPLSEENERNTLNFFFIGVNDQWLKVFTKYPHGAL